MDDESARAARTLAARHSSCSSWGFCVRLLTRLRSSSWQLAVRLSRALHDTSQDVREIEGVRVCVCVRANGVLCTHCRAASILIRERVKHAVGLPLHPDFL